MLKTVSQILNYINTQISKVHPKMLDAGKDSSPNVELTSSSGICNSSLWKTFLEFILHHRSNESFEFAQNWG